MSGSLNKVLLIGNLARDPEVRSFDNGGKVANLRVITNETWTDKEGNRKEQTEGHTVVIFNERLIEVAEKYLKKGDKVYVEGKNKTRKYTDKDGNERYVTEVELPRFNSVLTMLGGAGGGEGGRQDQQGDGYYGGTNAGGGGGGRGGDDRGTRGGSRNDDGNRGGGRGGSGGNAGGGNRGGFSDDLDDDVPFCPRVNGCNYGT